MPRISKDTTAFIKKYFPYIKVRENEVRFAVSKETTYTIPGELFPLRFPKTAQVFTYQNTEQLKQDSYLATLYNEVSFQTGHCYSNTENLKALFLKTDVRDFKTYTGWVFAQGMPIHHCWLVYKDKHVLDPGITIIDQMAQTAIKEAKTESKDEARVIYKKIHDEYINKPNSQIRTFGKVAPFALYVGSETTPNQGRIVFQELVKKYPEHPSYDSPGMNAHGASTLQSQLDS